MTILRRLGKKPRGKAGNLYDIVEVQCDCGKVFEAIESNIRHDKQTGCRECGIRKAKAGNIKRRDEAAKTFVSKAKGVHGDLYDYSDVVYETARIHVTIKCKRHGPWTCTPDNHLRGTGCPACGSLHLTQPPEGPQRLYYIKFINLNKWKIGITSKTVKERFRGEVEPYEIIEDVLYENGKEAWLEEQRLLDTFSKDLYFGPNLLNSGNTELFNIDIRKDNK